MLIPNQAQLEKVYGESTESARRFQSLADNFARIYNHDTAEFFTAPGRTEIIGNHTDHNGGRVIASSIDMDTIGAACPNNTNIIHITSEGYKKEIIVDLDNLDRIKKVSGTPALVAGIMEAIKKFGFKTAGFDAYISTKVIPAAGVSSSASFEMLICSMVNYFFNDNAMSYIDYAKAGQYSENVFWHKSSGLMDQLACAVGGPILLDFSDKENPKYEKLSFSFHDINHHQIIVNTGKGHADLSREYSEIPEEMKEAAHAAGAKRLCEITMDQLLEHVSEIKNDRAILRAMHFLSETKRVEDAAQAITDKNGEKFLRLLDESGTSSWELLQNCYTMKDFQEQKISLTLALTDLFLKKIGKGICRIHGGGFAGVIMCVVPEEETENYISYISKYVGRENVYPVSLRAIGAVHLDA